VDLSGKRTILSSGWTDLTGLAWSPRGEEVWFSGTRTGGSLALMAVTLSSRERLLSKILGDLVLFDVARDGRALVGREDWRGEIYGLMAGETAERNLTWFDFSVPSYLAPDGKALLFYEFGEAGGPATAAYLRKTDGLPPVRLADGQCGELSRDGQQAICISGTTGEITLVPTKSGETVQLTHDSLMRTIVKWLPGEKQIISYASEAGKAPRLYVQDVPDGVPRPITPEGVNFEPIAPSPDGKLVAATMGIEHQPFLYPVDGSGPRPIPGLRADDLPTGWSPDSRFLYVYRFGELPARLYRMELATGKKQPWKELMPPDPAGLLFIFGVRLTSDAKRYVYAFNRKLDDLYIVDGLN
jgi:eukaryotic-like serine/threonine-protein kinase